MSAVDIELAGEETRTGKGKPDDPTTSTSRYASHLRQLGGVIVALAAWEVVTASHAVHASILPSLSSVASSLGGHLGTIAARAGTTLVAWAIGLVIALCLGVALGMVVGRFRAAADATEMIVRMMRPLPSLAFIPIAILLAGLGIKMTAGLVAFAAFWPIFINTRYGASQIDRRVMDAARMLRLGRTALTLRVLMPATAPAILAGIQVAISLALVAAVSVELVSGSGGIGQYVLNAEQGGAISNMYAGIVVGGIIGWALNLGFVVTTKRAFPWRYQKSAEST